MLGSVLAGGKAAHSLYTEHAARREAVRNGEPPNSRSKLAVFAKVTVAAVGAVLLTGFVAQLMGKKTPLQNLNAERFRKALSDRRPHSPGQEKFAVGTSLDR